MSIGFLATVLIFLGLVACTESTPSFSPARPTPQGKDTLTDTLNDIRDFADLFARGVRTNNDLLNDPALTSVTSEFGPTIIDLKNLPSKSELAIADVKPWSSWWYPKKDGFVFTNRDGSNSSTFGKYDLVRKKKDGQAASALDFERKNHNGNGPNWEGLCDAWALAAISSPEPKRAVTMQVGRSASKTVTFQISDLKALLLKSFEAVDDSSFKYYGQKFTGDRQGWIYPDIFPEQLHRFIEIQLFQNRQAFVMDHDPGIEVWNVPVFKANYTMAVVPDNPNAVFVRIWLYSAQSTQNNELDFVGTKEAIREYNYVLEGVRDSNNILTVTSGYWVKGPSGIDSRKDHPDYLLRIPDAIKIVRKSWNPELDISIVDEILNQSY